MIHLVRKRLKLSEILYFLSSKDSSLDPPFDHDD